jgi:hypothetical protein
MVEIESSLYYSLLTRELFSNSVALWGILLEQAADPEGGAPGAPPPPKIEKNKKKIA